MFTEGTLNRQRIRTNMTDPANPRIEAAVANLANDEGKRSFSEKKTDQARTSTKPAQGASSLFDDLLNEPIGEHSILTRSANRFTPNFSWIDYILSECDTILLASRQFNSEFENLYSPHFGKIYYFTIIWYRILKIMQRDASVTEDQQHFIYRCEESLKIHESVIDGLVAAHLTQLETAIPSNPNYGPIIPYLPSIADHPFNQGSEYQWPDEYVTCLPNLVTLFRCARRLQIGAGGLQEYTSYLNLTTEDAPAAAVNTPAIALGTGTRITRLARANPGLAHRVTENRILCRKFRNRFQEQPEFLPYADDYDYQTETSFFRLNHSTEWFKVLSRIMAKRAIFINSSVVYSQIRSGPSPSGFFELRRSTTIVDEMNDRFLDTNVATPANLIIDAAHPNRPFANAGNRPIRELMANGMPFPVNTWQTYISARFHTLVYEYRCVARSREPQLPTVHWRSTIATQWSALPMSPITGDSQELPIHRIGPFFHHPIEEASAPLDPAISMPRVLATKWIIMKPEQPKPSPS